ncbi:DUF721 domain-containing protein [Calothrix sp. 336/3]|uniref:DUF721 domain-containing protein n=1 Tax=Calothrix sp. 336/3 TaxID=1337936 RepID=UPI0004E41CF3|nr:DciA family protein [Calothrix sp. 336/3]AKG22823.1 RNA-binding protein containing Zn ribbon [Calothrix sp. 336/3]
MSLKSVTNILDVLQIQTQYQEQPVQILLRHWAEIVGKVIASHAKPLSIQRDVLKVATSSAAWAQNLTFERQKLLVKINAVLPTPLLDIRFSTNGWQIAKAIANPPTDNSPQQHPSYLHRQINQRPSLTNKHKTASLAFSDWAQTIKGRSQGLPHCPQCQCPTPSGELQRWGVCSLCAGKKFSQS